MLERITNYLLWLWVFLIPWQTRWIIVDPVLEGSAWEYGRLSLYGGDILFAILIVITFIQWLKDKRVSKIYFWPFVLLITLVAWTWFSIIWSSDHLVGFYYALRLAQVLMLLGIVIVVKPKAKLVITSLVGAAALQGGIAIAQFSVQWMPAFKWLGLASQTASELGPGVVETVGGRWLRAYGSLPHPNILGGFLCAGLLGAVYLLSVTSKRGRWWLWLGLAVIAQGLVLSFSRSGWLGLAFGAMLLLILALKNKEVFKKIIFLVVLITTIFAINFAIFQDLFFTRLATTGRLEVQSITERETQLGLATQAIELHHLGLGVGNYTHWLQKIYPKEPGYIYQPVHNQYLLIWAELGLFGIVIFIIFLGFIFKAKIRTDYRDYQAYFLAVLVSFLAIAAFDHYFWTSYSGILLFGLVISCLMIKQRQ